MQLNEGKIELNGICFRPGASIDEVLENPGFQSYVNVDGSSAIFASKNVDVTGYKFDVDIYFKERRLSEIELTPVNLKMKDPGYPNEEYQKEKKKVADYFLRNNLGDPQEETEAVLVYDFPWGSITSIAYLNGRNKYDGGFIEIKYRKQEDF